MGATKTEGPPGIWKKQTDGKFKFIVDKPKKCSGHRKTWPWKGYSCGATPKHWKNGAWWCKNHLPE